MMKNSEFKKRLARKAAWVGLTVFAATVVLISNTIKTKENDESDE